LATTFYQARKYQLSHETVFRVGYSAPFGNFGWTRPRTGARSAYARLHLTQDHPIELATVSDVLRGDQSTIRASYTTIRDQPNHLLLDAPRSVDKISGCPLSLWAIRALVHVYVEAIRPIEVQRFLAQKITTWKFAPGIPDRSSSAKDA
jgi:hypothetical protein